MQTRPSPFRSIQSSPPASLLAHNKPPCLAYLSHCAGTPPQLLQQHQQPQEGTRACPPGASWSRTSPRHARLKAPYLAAPQELPLKLQDQAVLQPGCTSWCRHQNLGPLCADLAANMCKCWQPSGRDWARRCLRGRHKFSTLNPDPKSHHVTLRAALTACMCSRGGHPGV